MAGFSVSSFDITKIVTRYALVVRSEINCEILRKREARNRRQRRSKI